MKNWYFDSKEFKKELVEFIYWKINENEIDSLGDYLFELAFIWICRIIYIVFFPVFISATVLNNIKRKK